MTAQIHEILILDGQKTSMANELDIPTSLPGLTFPSDYIMSTACWRGYVGKWQIKNNKLYLSSVTGKYTGKFKPPVFADWISTTLRVPQGELLEYVHGGFGSTYERDLFIEVCNGNITSRRYENNSITESEQIF